MATYDPNKKKLPLDPLAAASPGAHAGMAAMNATPGTAYQAGAVTRNVGNVLGRVPILANQALQIPGQAAAGVVERFGRGLIGAQEAAPAAPLGNTAPARAPTTLAPVVVRPSATQAAPARNPASAGVSAGATPPAGGVPAPNPSDVLGTFNGRQITRAQSDVLAGKLPTANGPVVMGPNGSFAASAGAPLGTTPPAAAPAASAQPNLAVNIPRPATADPYNVRQSTQQRDALLSKLDSAQFAAGLMQNSNGKRDLQGRIAGAQTDLVNGGGQQAVDIASGDRNTRSQYDLAGVDQQGQNQRALLGDVNARDLEALRQSGETNRTNITTTANLNKPERVTDANGNVVNVVGNSATPITGADGKPLNAGVPKDANQASADGIMSAYNAQLKAITDSTQYGQQPDLTALNASPIGQRMQQIVGGGNSGAAGAPSTAPNLSAYKAAARKAGFTESDAELEATFNRKYGQGK